jgi:hydrogenase maturation protease
LAEPGRWATIGDVCQNSLDAIIKRPRAGSTEEPCGPKRRSAVIFRRVSTTDWGEDLKTLVLGVGNPLLGDDGVGFHVVQELLREVGDETPNLDIREASIGGLNLLDVVLGYDKVVLVDAIKTDCGEVGEVYRLAPEDFAGTMHLTTSAHDTNLATALKIGNEFAREQMPKEIVIFAIEVEEVTKFTQDLTERVRKAVPKAVDLVLQEIGLGQAMVS